MFTSRITIDKILQKYQGKLNQLDLEILLAFAIDKTREFVITHPRYRLTGKQKRRLKKILKRRLKEEPLAHIVGYKEFYGLTFTVNKHTLIPRPETELLVDSVLKILTKEKSAKKYCLIDIGTGSGNIIISIAKKIKKSFNKTPLFNYFAVDISSKALSIAKQNSIRHNLDNEINFLTGNLLAPVFNTSNLTNFQVIILANLPYLSDEIYNSTPATVKSFEPKLALHSAKNGLAHYEELFQQLKRSFFVNRLTNAHCFLEISPEQKTLLQKTVRRYFPNAKINWQKDLAGKWRLCHLKI